MSEVHTVTTIAEYAKHYPERWDADRAIVEQIFADAPGMSITFDENGRFLTASKIAVAQVFNRIMEMKPASGREDEPDRRPSKALVACLGGHAVILMHQGGDLDYEFDNMGSSTIDSLGTPPEDGIWVWEGKYIDAGPSDWGHGREVELDGEYRLALPEEFRRFKDDEHIWDEPSDAQRNAEEADRLERSGEYLRSMQELSALRFIADAAERVFTDDTTEEQDPGLSQSLNDLRVLKRGQALNDLRDALKRRTPPALMPNDDDTIMLVIERVSKAVIKDLLFISFDSMMVRGRRIIEQGLLRILRETKAMRLGDAQREAEQYRTRSFEESDETYRHPWHSPHCYVTGAHRDPNLCTCGLTDLRRTVARVEQSAAHDLQQAEEDGAVAMLEAIVGRLRYKADSPDMVGLGHAFKAAASEAQTMDDVASVQQAIRERKLRRAARK